MGSNADSPLDTFTSAVRVAKLERALAFRQPTLAVVIENIHDPHNFNAILRSCDAVGVSRIAMVYTIEQPPKLVHTSSSGAYKWMDLEHYPSFDACASTLKAEGFQLLGTKLDANAKPLYEHALTTPTALVLGNEHRGISADAVRCCDELLYIPMRGMAESLNVSVAAAVCLFEAMRQREAIDMYDTPQLSQEARRSKLTDWLIR